MIRTVGSIQRALQIAIVHLLGAIGYLMMRCILALKHCGRPHSSSVQRLQGRILRYIYVSLGATFVKVGQVLSTRPDLVSDETALELRKLQDNVPPFDFKYVKSVLETDLGGRLEDHFRDFQQTPIAAASVAQVHRATLPCGTPVAVKILRPNVRRLVERDGRIMRALARAVERFLPGARMSRPVEHAEHILQSIMEQTDLSLELQNYQQFHKNFEKVDSVVFPTVYPEFSSPRLLTMTFCEGEKLEAVAPSRYPVIAERFRRAFLKMAFDDGFLHADLHPGNFRIMDDNRIAIFDVGLVCRITGRTLEHFVDFAKCVTMGTADDLVHHLRTYHAYLSDIDWPTVTAEAEAIVTRLREVPTSELEWGGFIAEILALTRKHNIRPLPELVMVMVGVVTTEGIGKQINPHANTFNDIATFILPILARKNMLPVAGLPSGKRPA